MVLDGIWWFTISFHCRSSNTINYNHLDHHFWITVIDHKWWWLTVMYDGQYNQLDCRGKKVTISTVIIIIWFVFFLVLDGNWQILLDKKKNASFPYPNIMKNLNKAFYGLSIGNMHGKNWKHPAYRFETCIPFGVDGQMDNVLKKIFTKAEINNILL